MEQSLLVIIIIIIMLIVITFAAFKTIKYYYLKYFNKEKFKDYVKYELLPTYEGNFENSLSCLENNINAINTTVNNTLQALNIGINMLRRQPTENTTYNLIEQDANNCKQNIVSIRKYYIDMNEKNEDISLLNEIINKLNDVIRLFSNTTNGFLRTLEDTMKMSKEEELKEEAKQKISEIRDLYYKLK